MRYGSWASILILGALLALGVRFPALAQEQGPRDQIQSDDPTATESPESIMRRTLPYLDGQVLHYRTGDGQPDGWARRRGLTIRFYDAQGNYLGLARRVSQAVTRYYGPAGDYLGRRVNQRLSISAEAVVPPSEAAR